MPTATKDWVVSSLPPTSPATHAFAISTSDTVELAHITRGIYVGVGGDIVVITLNGETVMLKGAIAGSVIPISVKIVKAATTATDLVGLY